MLGIHLMWMANRFSATVFIFFWKIVFGYFFFQSPLIRNFLIVVRKKTWEKIEKLLDPVCNQFECKNAGMHYQFVLFSSNTYEMSQWRGKKDIFFSFLLLEFSFPYFFYCCFFRFFFFSALRRGDRSTYFTFTKSNKTKQNK